MADLLPPYPRFVFTILEPASLLAAFFAPFIAPQYFISSQLVSDHTGVLDDNARLIMWQLANLYLLLGILGVFILNTTSEVKTVRAYLWALWLGDIGHVGFSLFAMGYEGALDVKRWSATIHGNVSFTVFLFLSRSLYLMGAFEGTLAADQKLRKPKSKRR